MKTRLYWLLLLATPLMGTPALYEGFDMKSLPIPIGSGTGKAGQTSQGWLSDWHLKDGAARVLADDLTLTGLESVKGLSASKGKTVAMRQMAETFTGEVYGSFRVRGTKLKPNSMLGLMFSLPDAEPMNPKTSLLSFLAARWGADLGGIVVGGKPVRVDQGAPLRPGQTALVLWKIDNLPEPGQKSDQVIQMWILNEAQVAHFSDKGMPEKALKNAVTGEKPEQVMQVVRASTRGSRLTLVKGLVVSCFTAEVPKADFDEIRISRESLADAAGVRPIEPVPAN